MVDSASDAPSAIVAFCEADEGVGLRLIHSLEQHLTSRSVIPRPYRATPQQDHTGGGVPVRSAPDRALLVVVGKGWRSAGRPNSAGGLHHLLHDVAGALSDGRTIVVPVLVAPVGLDAMGDLPDDVAALAERGHSLLAESTWDEDVLALARTLDCALDLATAPSTLALEVLDGEGPASRHEFSIAGGTIGRARNNDWVLPDRRVSARHALIAFRSGVFSVADAFSANGVFVNSRDLPLPPGSPCALRSGDRLFIDPYEIRATIRIGSAPESRDRDRDTAQIGRVILGDPPARVAIDSGRVAARLPGAPAPDAGDVLGGSLDAATPRQREDRGLPDPFAGHDSPPPSATRGGGTSDRPPDRPADLVCGPRVALDENVQFTVYRRAAIEPDRWYPMLVFAHLSERRADAPPGEPDPIAEVQAQAAQFLGDTSTFRSGTEDSAHPVAREGELCFVPRIDGVTFNPPERRFLWTESVHREDFRMRADSTLHGRVARGAVSVYTGNLLLADIQVSIKVSWQAGDAPHQETHARPYRRIFASYSHRDTAIVEEFEAHAAATGDKYLRDVVTLRAGEVWDARLTEMIRQADIFQLFWSWNALASPLVREEWQQALSLNRPHFVRPVYWEEPLPEEGGLPPAQLRRLHFQRVFPKAPRIPAAPVAHAAPAIRPAGGPPAPDATLAPAAPGVMRFVRYGSVAAAAVLAVGLCITAFDTWTLPSSPVPSVNVELPPDPSSSPVLPGPADSASPPPAPAEPPAPSAERGRGGAGRSAVGVGEAPAARRGGGGTPSPGAAGSSGTGAAPVASGKPVVLPVPPLHDDRPTVPDPAKPPMASRPTPLSRGAVPPEQAIRRTFRAYEGAWAVRDRAALGRVWSMSADDARQIDNVFRRLRAADVTIAVRQIQMEGPTRAIAQVEETRRLEDAGGQRSTVTLRRTFHLEHRDGSWVIVRIG